MHDVECRQVGHTTLFTQPPVRPNMHNLQEFLQRTGSEALKQFSKPGKQQKLRASCIFSIHLIMHAYYRNRILGVLQCCMDISLFVQHADLEKLLCPTQLCSRSGILLYVMHSSLLNIGPKQCRGSKVSCSEMKQLLRLRCQHPFSVTKRNVRVTQRFICSPG